MVAAVLVLAVGMWLAPAVALAQRPSGMGGGRGGANGRAGGASQWSGGHGRYFNGHGHHFKGHSHFKGHHHHFVRPFVPFAFATVPSVVYAAPFYAPPVTYAPPTYYEPPAYYPPPTYYSPPPTYYSPPRGGGLSVAPMETVVQYSHGRYELRGDGISAPYRWVWIPNPPPPPPVAPPPAEPPAAAPSSNGANGSNGPAPTRQSQLFRWTDRAGVVHWTDRIDAVPEEYRAQARQPRPS